MMLTHFLRARLSSTFMTLHVAKKRGLVLRTAVSRRRSTVMPGQRPTRLSVRLVS